MSKAAQLYKSEKISDSIAEWVITYHNRPDGYMPHGVGLVAERMSTADLFRAHAECIRYLAGPLRDAERERWAEALDAVCETLGKRVDGAYSRGMR